VYFNDLFVKAALWVVGLTVAIVWIYALVRALLPRLGDALTCFVATPGGIVLVVLLWRALGRRPAKKKS